LEFDGVAGLANEIDARQALGGGIETGNRDDRHPEGDESFFKLVGPNFLQRERESPKDNRPAHEAELKPKRTLERNKGKAQRDGNHEKEQPKIRGLVGFEDLEMPDFKLVSEGAKTNRPSENFHSRHRGMQHDQVAEKKPSQDVFHLAPECGTG